MLVVYAIALCVQSLNAILGVVGAIATVPITLTLPGIYMALLARGGLKGVFDRVVGWGCFVMGMLITVFCLYGTLAGPQ